MWCNPFIDPVLILGLYSVPQLFLDCKLAKTEWDGGRGGLGGGDREGGRGVVESREGVGREGGEEERENKEGGGREK